MKKSLNLKNEIRAKRLLIIVFLLILGIGGWIFLGKEASPQFFPLNNKNETYEVVKNTEGIYSILYSGKSDYGINSATIVKSPINLDPLIGKKVYLSGSFTKTTTQCIADACNNIGYPFVGLYINSIKENPNIFVSQRPRDKIIFYTVVNGDTLKSISDKFSISVDTIKWENNLTTKQLKVGQILKILPVTGVSHIVQKGDTVDALAEKYHTTKQKIIDYPFNNYADLQKLTLISGEVLIIPDGKK